jgi:hypothetical protein
MTLCTIETVYWNEAAGPPQAQEMQLYFLHTHSQNTIKRDHLSGLDMSGSGMVE